MARTHLTRQKEFEIQASATRRRWEQDYHRDSAQQGRYAPPRMADTLGPQEDVMESRRRRRNRVVMETPRSGTKGILMENILLLVVLILSIYGLYQLSIHLLNQA